MITKIIKARWSEAENRRIFFMNFAKDNNFDALNTNEWYSQSRDKIMSTKVNVAFYLFIY